MAEKKKTNIVGIMVGVLIAALIIVMIFTRKNKNVAEVVPEFKKQISEREIAVKKFTSEEKQKLENLLSEKKILEISDFSHEAWVDIKWWETMNRVEKKEMIYFMSKYFRTIDGTPQVTLKDKITNKNVGELFGDLINIF